jgi:uncharacterized membrane protein HdeD (DUF308 family)
MYNRLNSKREAETMTASRQTPISENQKQTIASYWWMPLVRGILLVLFGVIMFARPGATVLSLIWLLGIYWIVDGTFSILEGLREHAEKSRIWVIVGGILGIVAGLIIVGNPVVAGIISGSLIAWLIGIAIIANGIVLIVAGRDGQWTWGGLVMGILYILFGIFVISNPLVSLVAGAWAFAFWALVSGILAIVLAFRLRGFSKESQPV